jgi:hypothetical protein
MNDTRQVIPIVGFAATVAFAACMVTLLHAQTTVLTNDFSNAAVAEVHDAQGQVLLRGQFSASDEQDEEEVERKASLQPAGSDTDAAGEAEVEYSKTARAQQEIEFSVENLTAGSAISFVIDGQVVGKAAVDRRGSADFELDVAP